MKNFRALLIIAFSCLFVASCDFDKSNASSDVAIIEANLKGVKLYIPKDYLKFRHTSVGTESALLQAWYPGAAIPPGDSGIELKQQGIWKNNIRILVNVRDSEIDFDKFARKATKHLGATKLVGEEFGLLHFEQESSHSRDLWDVWFEEVNGKYASYITCSEQLTENATPSCSNTVYTKNRLWLKISYDRRLLPHWNEIQNNVLDLFNNLEKKETAKDFYISQNNKEVNNVIP